MPMIDAYATTGTFSDKHALAHDLVTTVMRWEQLPPISLFRDNTAFIHDLPAGAISNVTGDSNYIRIQVLTPIGTLDRAKQLGVVKELTMIVTAVAGDPTQAERTWVLVTRVTRRRVGHRRSRRHQRRHRQRSAGEARHGFRGGTRRPVDPETCPLVVIKRIEADVTPASTVLGPRRLA
jgi:hypothetical protein